MGYKFNPFTGNFDTTDSPNGVFDSVEVDGDITLDDGGAYATTLQLITPTANRTISFPDATGTVGLVGGASGQLVYNNAGAYAGAPSTSVGTTGNITLSLAGAASTPPVSFTGSWFTGGTSTTTKPQLLIEPTGTTSTAWSTSGTGLGVNAASGFAGNLLDLQVNGSRIFSVESGGSIQGPNTAFALKTFSTNSFEVIQNSFRVFQVNWTTGVKLAANYSFSWTSGANDVNTTVDLSIFRDAANILAQRNGTNAQTYRLYNTYTDASNYQRTSITDDSTGLVIDQQYAGTGAARTNLLDLKNNGTSKVTVNSAGTLTVNSNILLGGVSDAFVFSNRGRIDATADGVFRLLVNAQNSFNRLVFGLATSAFPSLKRNGVVLETKLADDSGYAQHAASVFEAATAHTVAGLPGTPTVGMIARVTDATAPAVGLTVAGGGAAAALVWWNGSNWTVIGV